MYLGIDFGTTGARACVIDTSETVQHEERFAYPHPESQTPDDWKLALHRLLSGIPANIRSNLLRIAIDATSGTVLLCDANLKPVSPALLYNDTRAQHEARQLKELAPEAHIGSQANSGLAKFLWLVNHCDTADAAFMMHQADWLSALLTGHGGVTDYHNALKTGFDVERLCWPDWIRQLPKSHLLPHVVAPGHQTGELSPAIASAFGLNPDCTLHAGTTDSIAAFIAARVNMPGDAVTSLGTTLALKLLSKVKVDDARFGIYSHRYGDLWLAGGASNAGAGILKRFFTDEQIISLSQQIDPETDSELDYYPLPCAGERFPVYNPSLQPRLAPRPKNDAAFLHGLLQSLSKIEADGYKKLAEAGATHVSRVSSSGGGAKNPVWQQIRHRILNVPVTMAVHSEASFGSALLAKYAGITPPLTHSLFI